MTCGIQDFSMRFGVGSMIKDMPKTKSTKIVCLIIARCYHWGKSWKRHWYDEKGVCYRCGIKRGED
jgi:hypothetical protein